MIKLITIIGARPQFIKASSLSREIAKHDDIEEVIVHTGQHFDENMSKIFFDEMEIPKPKYNLEINSLSHGAMTGRMLEEIEKVLTIEKPDWVIVYGDTNSTLAGAMAAQKMGIPVAHIEAGLRSGDMNMPEEVNRILTDQISSVLFCPTQTAIDNLSKEGFDHKKVQIVNCGDIMLDSALYYKRKMKKPKNFELMEGFILATIHRQENTDNKDKLSQIVKTFNELHQSGNQIVCPIHPRTRKLMATYDLKPEFLLMEPVGYLEMIYLLEHCKSVITDSGGLQKEAYFYKKFCITLRDTTEWVELVEHDVNILLSIDEKLTENIDALLDRSVAFEATLYGKGDTSKRIIECILFDGSPIT